ncbi:hypothetical protein [Streptomyces sp. NPDC002845]
MEITLGALPVQYYPLSSELTARDLSPGQDEVWGQLISQSSSLRRISVPLPSGKHVRLFLHWSDGTDLDDLDRKIIEGKPCDVYFAGALAGGDMTLQCRSCRAEFFGIVADTGNPLLGDVPARLRAHEFVGSCPVCGAEFQPHVLYVGSPI